MTVRSLLARAFALVMLATLVAHAQAEPEPALRQLEQDMGAAALRGDWQFAGRILALKWTAALKLALRFTDIFVQHQGKWVAMAS